MRYMFWLAFACPPTPCTHARTHQRKHTHLHSRSPFCFIHCKPFQLPIGYGVNLCHVYFCLFFVCFPLVASRLTSGAAVDRHDSERHHTAVINLLDTRNDRIEEDNAGVARTTADYDNSYYYEDNYDNEEEDYELSGDVDLPRGRPKNIFPWTSPTTSRVFMSWWFDSQSLCRCFNIVFLPLQSLCPASRRTVPAFCQCQWSSLRGLRGGGKARRRERAKGGRGIHVWRSTRISAFTAPANITRTSARLPVCKCRPKLLFKLNSRCWLHLMHCDSSQWRCWWPALLPIDAFQATPGKGVSSSPCPWGWSPRRDSAGQRPWRWWRWSCRHSVSPS